MSELLPKTGPYDELQQIAFDEFETENFFASPLRGFFKLKTKLF
jgi:hypothetical protein